MAIGEAESPVELTQLEREMETNTITLCRRIFIPLPPCVHEFVKTSLSPSLFTHEWVAGFLDFGLKLGCVLEVSDRYPIPDNTFSFRLRYTTETALIPHSPIASRCHPHFSFESCAKSGF